MSNFLIPSLIFFLATLSSSIHSEGIAYTSNKYDIINKDVVSRTITVDLSGRGDFSSVQQAIDSVPHNNNLWTLIHIKAGIYKHVLNYS